MGVFFWFSPQPASSTPRQANPCACAQLSASLCKRQSQDLRSIWGYGLGVCAALRVMGLGLELL